MKTKAQIIESLKKWYGMGADLVTYYDDQIMKCICFRQAAFTSYAQHAIIGENEYAVTPDWGKTDYGINKQLYIQVYYNE